MTEIEVLNWARGPGLQIATIIFVAGVVILFSLVFWGWMWGIVGMVLSVPIMAIIKTVMEQFPTTRPIAILMGNGVPENDEADNADTTAPVEGNL